MPSLIHPALSVLWSKFAMCEFRADQRDLAGKGARRNSKEAKFGGSDNRGVFLSVLAFFGSMGLCGDRHPEGRVVMPKATTITGNERTSYLRQRSVSRIIIIVIFDIYANAETGMYGDTTCMGEERRECDVCTMGVFHMHVSTSMTCHIRIVCLYQPQPHMYVVGESAR